MNRWIGIVMVACVLFGTFSNAIADDSWKNVATKGKLVIGLCAQYPPFESKNEKTGELEGFDVDMGRSLAEKLGVRADFVDA